ncbi:MAG: hypothetical protein Q4B29_01845 [Candidatus Saccharibacteria bacterium]|nr:hypothetical protein [Candidatus Saccharibacteria bacterium]
MKKRKGNSEIRELKKTRDYVFALKQDAWTDFLRAKKETKRTLAVLEAARAKRKLAGKKLRAELQEDKTSGPVIDIGRMVASSDDHLVTKMEFEQAREECRTAKKDYLAARKKQEELRFRFQVIHEEFLCHKEVYELALAGKH